jgi:hypothetical protein
LEELVKNIVGNPKFFEQHEVPNEFLLEIIDDILVLNQYYLLHNITPVYTFTQDSIKTLIQRGHLDLEELQYLTLNTYYNFNKEFINEYQDHLNWNKIILKKANVNGLVSFNTLEKKKISELNLWDLVSSFQLEKKFIKKYRQFLNWNIISMTNDFTNDELPKYPELVNYKVSGTEELVKIITATELNEDGFLAFDNINPDVSKVEEIRNKNSELIGSIQNGINQNNKEAQDIINKMKEANKETYTTGSTYSMRFTIPVGKIEPEEAKKALSELITNYNKPIEFDESLGTLILDGKTQIPYQKEIWLGSPNIEMITDTTTTPLDTFIPVNHSEISIVGRLINKIKNIFNGK